jgi:hypothetical protein
VRCHLSHSRVLGSGGFTNFKRGNGDFARNLLNREARRRACRKQLHDAAGWGDTRCGQVGSRTLSRGVATLSFSVQSNIQISTPLQIKVNSEIGVSTCVFRHKKEDPPKCGLPSQ